MTSWAVEQQTSVGMTAGTLALLHSLRFDNILPLHLSLFAFPLNVKKSFVALLLIDISFVNSSMWQSGDSIHILLCTVTVIIFFYLCLHSMDLCFLGMLYTLFAVLTICGCSFFI